MDQLLQAIDTSKVPGYQEFMHDLIVEDISNHDLNFETLNSFLFEWNKQVYDAVCEKAISYYDTYATEKIKSLGNWTCLGNDANSFTDQRETDRRPETTYSNQEERNREDHHLQ